MTRLASRVFPLSVKDQETVRAHWKRLKSDKEREMQQAEENRQRKLEAAAATEAARRAVSATPVSKRTRIDPYSNPVPWRRK
jgi:hypothetical protein